MTSCEKDLLGYSGYTPTEDNYGFFPLNFNWILRVFELHLEGNKLAICSVLGGGG